MTPIVRLFRGVLGTALVWGVAWLTVGVALGIYRALKIFGRLYPVPTYWWTIVSTVAAIWAVWGVVSGAAFAIALAIAERRRNLAELSTLRVAIWGAVGANFLPLGYFAVVLTQKSDVALLGPFAIVASVCTMLGAGAAAGTLALARRSTDVAA